MNYAIVPLGLKDDELKVYMHLYSKCDFKTMICEYTERNILLDIKADFTRKRLGNILRMFIELGLFVTIEKGVKGKPSKLFINKEIMWNQIGTESEPNENQISLDIKGLEGGEEPNGSQIGTKKEPSIKEKKKKEKEINIYSDIFDYWKTVFTRDSIKYSPAIETTIKKAIEQNSYSVDEVKYLINRHKEIVALAKDTEYPVKKRSIKEFFGQGISHNNKLLICTQFEPTGKYGAEYKTKDSGQASKTIKAIPLIDVNEHEIEYFN